MAQARKHQRRSTPFPTLGLFLGSRARARARSSIATVLNGQVLVPRVARRAMPSHAAQVAGHPQPDNATKETSARTWLPIQSGNLEIGSALYSWHSRSRVTPLLCRHAGTAVQSEARRCTADGYAWRKQAAEGINRKRPALRLA